MPFLFAQLPTLPAGRTIARPGFSTRRRGWSGDSRPVAGALLAQLSVFASCANAQEPPSLDPVTVETVHSALLDGELASGMVQTETRDLKRGAIAEVALDQRTEGLQIDLARPMRASTLLDQAGNGHRGIGQLNQESGIANQQANLLALAALKASPSTEIGLISAASVQQTAISNRVNRYDLDGENRIDQAFNGASGVVQVNQAIGVGNSQANLFALAFAPASAEADVFALSDIGLSQVASDNEAANGEIVINARNTISQSFGNFSGAAQVSQTAGALNLVANAITINIGLAGGAP